MNWAVKNVMTTEVIWVERDTPFAAIAAAQARGVTAFDLMTAPPVTVAPDDTVEDAARLMYLPDGLKTTRLPPGGMS